MPRNAHALADEIEGMWARAEREGRDLTAAERNTMQELVEAAKSQHNLEKSIRELDVGAYLGRGPSFAAVTAADPNHSFAGCGPGDVFVKSAAYQKIADPSGRGQTWTTGPVEVSSGRLLKGTLLEAGTVVPVADSSRPRTSPASSRNCSSRSASPTCSASRT